MSRFLPLAPALVALLGLGAGSAYAQSTERFHADIPFDFKVGRTVLPAGTYDVSYDATEAPGVLVVRSKDGHHEVFALTENVTTHNPKRAATFVFEREGSVYALSEVFAAQAEGGLELIGTHVSD